MTPLTQADIHNLRKLILRSTPANFEEAQVLVMLEQKLVRILAEASKKEPNGDV